MMVKYQSGVRTLCDIYVGNFICKGLKAECGAVVIAGVFLLRSKNMLINLIGDSRVYSCHH